MTASEGLSPAQFGFLTVPKEEWADAQDMAMNSLYSSGIPRRAVVHPDTPIHTGQAHIYPDTVAAKEKSRAWRSTRMGALPEEQREMLDDDPERPMEVMRHKGKLYMGEGHHRLAAARRLGKSVAVHLYDSGEK